MRISPRTCAAIWTAVAASLPQSAPARESAALAAEPLPIACSPERATVPVGEAVRLRAWASSASPQALKYVWQPTVGAVEGRGAEVRWDLTGVKRAGTYAAAVRVEHPGGGSADCLLRVIVRSDPGARGGLSSPPAPPSRETGAALLGPDQSEIAGYGLYSYLLLGSPPSEAARERYRKTIEAFWELIPEMSKLEQYVPRNELNIAYLPVKDTPRQAVSADWLLGNYDFARARSVLRNLPGSNREGPYIISVLRPLGGAAGASGAPGSYLFQDLTRVPPHLVASWVKEFLNQAAQERFWEERTGERLALKLRVTVGVLGMGLPEVRKALDTWIAWVR